jgi:rod shape-determining protein MreD
MAKKAVAGFILIVIAALQVSASPAIFGSRYSPNLVLIFLVFFSLGKDFSASWKMAIFCGLVLDAFYFWPFGLNVASFLCVVFLLSFLSKRFSVSQKGGFFLNAFFLMAVSSASYHLTLFFFVEIFRQGGIFLGGQLLEIQITVGRILQGTLLNILFFSLLFWPVLKIRRLFGLYQRDSFEKTRFMR